MLACVVALLPISAAQADVIQDCSQDDVLNQKYSKGELQKALNDIPGDVDEYTLCRSAINKALTGEGPTATGSANDGSGPGSGAGSGGSGDGSSGPGGSNGEDGSSSGERQQLAALNEVLDSPNPGAAGTVATSNGMPAPALLALIALGCLAIGGGVYLAAKRNPAFANALRRVPLPKRRG